MLGRKDYTTDEVDHARKAIEGQINAYRQLVKAVDGDPQVSAKLEAFEHILFTNMVLVLDRYFVHRLRLVTGRDGNPLNEVEMLTESLMNNGGTLRGNNVIKYKREQSVLGLELGDTINLGVTDFERLADAFLADIDAKFVK